MKPSLCASLAAGLLLAACSSTPKPPYRAETFDQESPYQHHYDASADRTCEAARRGLLSQGYIVTDAQPHALKAEKSFQPQADDHIVLQFNVMCVPAAADGTTVYSNVVQSHYQVKKSASAASVGVSAIGSISLPWTSTNTDSMVRVGGETIDDAKFYNRFFELLERIIPQVPEKKITPPTPVVVQPIPTLPLNATRPAVARPANGGEPNAAPIAAPQPATSTATTPATTPAAGSTATDTKTGSETTTATPSNTNDATPATGTAPAAGDAATTTDTPATTTPASTTPASTTTPAAQ